ncbi:hypothetical protein BH10ACT1_BH10ACT1_42840 [soil metagenome]
MGEQAVGVQVDELGTWLWSADGRTAARADLRSHGLPHDPAQVDDVLGEVALGVFRRMARHGALQGSVPAYARRAIRNAVVDLARGHHDVSLDELLSADGGGPSLIDGPATDQDPFPAEPGMEQLLAIRLGLHADLSLPRADTWPVAAALAALTLSQGDVEPAPDLPRPDAAHGGAGKAELWAALAYAGQDRCFATPDTMAVRTRRTTAMARVRRTLQRALDAAHAIEPDRERPDGEPGGGVR